MVKTGPYKQQTITLRFKNLSHGHHVEITKNYSVGKWLDKHGGPTSCPLCSSLIETLRHYLRGFLQAQRVWDRVTHLLVACEVEGTKSWCVVVKIFSYGEKSREKGSKYVCAMCVHTRGNYLCTCTKKWNREGKTCTSCANLLLFLSTTMEEQLRVLWDDA